MVLESKWIHWDVGYAYDKKLIMSLTLKAVSDWNLPEYLKITRIIKGTTSLNQVLSDFIVLSETYPIRESRLFSARMSQQPLDDILACNK